MDRHKSVRMRPHIPRYGTGYADGYGQNILITFCYYNHVFAMTREMSLHIYSLESKHYNDVLRGSMVTVNNRKLKMKPLAG